jgi:cell division protein FtsB
MTAQPREPDVQARRLGFALRSLAAELVTERQRTAALRRENAELKAQIEALRGRPERGSDDDPADRR